MNKIYIPLIILFAGMSLCMMACRPDTPIWRKKDARAWVDTVMAQVVDDRTVHLRAAFQLGKEADREAAGFQISQTENFESDIREIEAEVIQDTLRALDTMLSEKTRYYVRAYLRTRTGIYYSPNAIAFETPEYILPGTIAELKCSTALHLGTIVAGRAGTGISKVAYTGGNGGRYNALSVPSSGVSGLTLTLDAGTFANGNDTLVFSISGTAATSGTASFVLSIGGQSCTISRTVSAISAAGLITGLVCFNPVNSGTLVHSVTTSGVSSVISYTGGNGLAHEGQVVNSTGVNGLTATLAPGSFVNGNGTLVYSISGTPAGSGAASFAISIGGQSCILSRTVDAGSINSISCSTAVNSGSLVAGVSASGVSSSISYSGSNGGAYIGQVVASTGVTGLTATHQSSGTLMFGSGAFVYTISGTPASSGTASFAISIAGQTCTLTRTIPPTWRPSMVHCGTPTSIVSVINPTTNKTWMDRNLGASQVATTSTDANAYGDLYQWGRFGDGHQCRNSGTTTTLSTTDTSGNANFILGSTDWRSSQNDNLWQGVNGINNPCPTGYRLPTLAELDGERQSWPSNTSFGAIASPLKIPVGGFRNANNGSLYLVGGGGHYWSATVSGSGPCVLNFNGSNANLSTHNRSDGFSVRCLQD